VGLTSDGLHTARNLADDADRRLRAVIGSLERAAERGRTTISTQ
jgi:hypothetical protein